MTFVNYLKEKAGFLIINGSLWIVCLIFLSVFQINLRVGLLIGGIAFIPLLSYMVLEYRRKKNYYNEMEETFRSLEEKYLLCEVMQEPKFLEEQIFYEILKKTHKAMHEQVNVYEGMQREYKEYIESWIHEIKTPIAAVNLIIENNPNEMSKKISAEIKQIEGYIEEALYYARSNDVNKDYIIKPFALRQVVMETIQKNARVLIYKRITPQMGELSEVVYSDSKWVVFILNQIIGNSIKYTKEENGLICITSQKRKNQVILEIADHGVGIDEKDIDRVFDKGFTGENGRKFIKSTGIGLYLCKKLCNKLGIGITLSSRKGEGTKVELIFPVDEERRLE